MIKGIEDKNGEVAEATWKSQAHYKIGVNINISIETEEIRRMCLFKKYQRR